MTTNNQNSQLDSATSGGTKIAPSANIGEGVILCQNIYLEENTTIGAGTVFSSSPEKTITVRTGAHIGAGSVIGPGIEIGQGAKIHPGSVVLMNVPANSVVEGNPARIIGYTSSIPGNVPAPEAIVPTVSSEADRHDVSIVPLGVGGAALYHMPRITDMRGSLTVGEFPSAFPFQPVRYFINFGVTSEKLRGEHAHRACHQILISAHGSCHALLDDGTSRREVVLDRPDLALYMPPMIWGTQYKYSQDSALLVFASHLYDPDDYIRTYDEFLAEVRRAK